MSSYLRPRTLHEALEALAAQDRIVVAGATDHYPARVGLTSDEDVLDISGIVDMGPLGPTDQGWSIPAPTTWSDVIDAGLPPLFDGLKDAARTVGGIQIQNRGTLCGNICNASPAADGVPILLALEASVDLASTVARRQMPLAEFVTGNRVTQRRGDELVTAIRVPARSPRTRSAFLKLGTRSSLVISIVMVAAVVDVEVDGRIESAAIAVGACSPVARRLPALEARLRGRTLSKRLAETVEADDLAPLSPIDDIRGSALYRREAALVLVRRVIETLAT